jgi:hypothetical protein
MVIAGFIGNDLNILVFTKLKRFRGNRCAFYLIVETIFNNLMLSVFFISQTFQIIYKVDTGNLSLIWCKIGSSLTQQWQLMIGSIICFEAFDQFLSTHHQFSVRQMSTLRLARYLISGFYNLYLILFFLELFLDLVVLSLMSFYYNIILIVIRCFYMD